MERTDQELIRSIAAGDAAAFAEFFDRHAPRVLNLLLKLTGDRDDAEDVLQDTFWRVWTDAHRFDNDRAPPLAWLFLIARSRAVDHLRQRRVRTEARSASQPACSDPAPCSDPSRLLEDHEEAQRVRAALAHLPQEQRHAITLAFFSGLTYEQVARHESIPTGTAKTRIRLGMRRLYDLLRSSKVPSP
jgi:RNA polymerase sigma-70 factor (ECF subfamily)